MTDLTDLNTHARRLSTSDHRDDCLLIHRVVKVDRWLDTHGLDPTLSCPNEDGHDSHDWVTPFGHGYECPGLCGGCMTEGERALWAQIADEVEGYLAPGDDGPGLFDDEGQRGEA